ncbi:MAG: hypothetical protein IPK63_20745 [Candidatus Competibacteraceae bacterium]|nr:hypothetical protein [Candidatus Competibacteraceae bacterium]
MKKMLQKVDKSELLASKKSNSSLLKKTAQFLHEILRKHLPKNRIGDRIVSYINFIMKNNRAPKNWLTLNDVLYAIKTTDEILDPLRVFVSDKEFLKLYVSAAIGDQHNVPTIDVIREAQAVSNYDFPATCCIKPTHASGQVIIRKNNEPIDRERIKRWFKLNYYDVTREANYRYLKPKVIIEPLIFNNAFVVDYKFLCYNGIPKIVWVDLDRYINHTRKTYDAEWNDLDLSLTKPKSNIILEKPNNFSEMLDISSKLSTGFSLVRIDLYTDNTHILVGEITNCSGNAGERFIPTESEYTVAKILFG